MSTSSMLETFTGALQGTISVLITLLAGYASASNGLCNRSTVRQISKLCTTLFLPCLIVEQMGPELTAKQLSIDWIIPLWGLGSAIVAHLLGYLGHRLLHIPFWTIVACGRPNSNALPLLLLQSLEHTGVLDALARKGESLSDVLPRAKSLLLLNAIVQQTITFQVAPGVLARDDGRAKDDADRLRPGPGRLTRDVQDPARIGLLNGGGGAAYGSGSGGQGDMRTALHDIEDTPDVRWPSWIAPLKKPVKKVASHFSPPLIGAIVALVLGITPPLHSVFLSQDGALYTSITQSVENLGELFVVLQTFIVGAELALVPRTDPGKVAMSYALLVRFVVMPALALLFVWTTAGRGMYVDDRLVWFLLVLIPSGPSAMLLVSVAELVNVDQGAIAGYLTISYLLSPVMAVVCSLGLKVVESVEKRP